MSIDAPKGRRKASECFPDDVKEFIVNMKSDNKPYVEIVEETKKKFPVNRSFKSIYLKKLMRKAIEACDAGQDLNTFFSSMEIDIAIDLVHSAWQEVPEHTIARSFSKVYPENPSELVDRKDKSVKEAAKALKEDQEFSELNRHLKVPYQLGDIEAILTDRRGRVGCWTTPSGGAPSEATKDSTF